MELIDARGLLIAPALWLLVACVNDAKAHEFHAHQEIKTTETESRGSDAPKKLVSLTGPTEDAFAGFDQTSTRIDGRFLVVESDGLPNHDMMIGIRAWQQQVPLPQPFEGRNAWRLPLNPRPASRPISVLRKPMRGAIALAVNGVPIFSALNNRGEDTYLAGELDKWGGHCGRGDDYHYHTAPVHLADTVGEGNPIAFALDGYPILGLKERDGAAPRGLDRFNGHSHDGAYHYHASEKFPYINGGLHGVVTMRGDQIEQPRDSPMRPGQPPLRGASITGFKRDGDEFELRYRVSGRSATIEYEVLSNGSVEFHYTDPSGRKSTKLYRRRGR